MYCGRCGAKLEADCLFCPDCGYPSRINPQRFNAQKTKVIDTAQINRVTEKVSEQAKKLAVSLKEVKLSKVNGISKRKTFFAIPLIAVVVVAAILISGRGVKTTARQFIRAFENADGYAIEKLLYPGDLDYFDPADVSEELEFMYNMAEGLYGEIDFEYEIVDIDNISESQFENIQDAAEDDGYKVRDAKELTVNMSVRVDGEDYESEELSLDLVKIKNRWYVSDYSDFY